MSNSERSARSSHSQASSLLAQPPLPQGERENLLHPRYSPTAHPHRVAIGMATIAATTRQRQGRLDPSGRHPGTSASATAVLAATTAPGTTHNARRPRAAPRAAPTITIARIWSAAEASPSTWPRCASAAVGGLLGRRRGRTSTAWRGSSIGIDRRRLYDLIMTIHITLDRLDCDMANYTRFPTDRFRETNLSKPLFI